MAVSGDDGTFEIKNIPAGKHEFQFWHEAAGYLKNVQFKGGNDGSPRPGRAHDRRRARRSTWATSRCRPAC